MHNTNNETALQRALRKASSGTITVKDIVHAGKPQVKVTAKKK